MDSKLLIIFIILNVVNVIIQTVKSIATVKCGKVAAAVVNAVAYGLYTVVLVYTVCDLPLWLKVIVVAFCNLVGVFAVKFGEEKARKDKLWKVEATIPNQGIDPKYDDCIIELKKSGVPFNYIDINKYLLINCYCATQKDSAEVKAILNQFNAKYFVSESKSL
jgi:hypothetical protein